MKTAKNYIRTYPLNFNELNEAQKKNAIDQLGEDVRETDWLIDPIYENEVLPLCNFVRLENSKLWHGFYGMSYFSGYFIRFDNSNYSCTVGYRHW